MLYVCGFAGQVCRFGRVGFLNRVCLCYMRAMLREALDAFTICDCV